MKKNRRATASQLVPRIAFDGMMVALALVLSLLDNMIPLNLVIPIAGVKLGLANVVSLFMLFFSGWVDALLVVVLRCVVMLGITGPMVFLFSLGGGLLALAVMICLRLLYPRWLGLIGVSIGGAVFHNVGQIIAAVCVFNVPALLTKYLPFLIIIGMFTGTLTAIAAKPVLWRSTNHKLERRN